MKFVENFANCAGKKTNLRIVRVIKCYFNEIKTLSDIVVHKLIKLNCVIYLLHMRPSVTFHM